MRDGLGRPFFLRDSIGQSVGRLIGLENRGAPPRCARYIHNTLHNISHIRLIHFLQRDPYGGYICYICKWVWRLLRLLLALLLHQGRRLPTCKIILMQLPFRYGTTNDESGVIRYDRSRSNSSRNR